MIIRLVNLFSSIPDADCHTLKLTGRLNIEPGGDDFLAHFEEILSAGCEYKQVTIDLKEVEFIYPAAIAFFLGLKSQLEKRKVHLNLEVKDDSDIACYLNYCGLGAVFPEITKIDISSSTVPLSQEDVMPATWTSKLADTNSIAEEIVDWFIQKQLMSSKVEAEVIDSIEEILRNIRQHSGFGNCYYAAQAYSRSRKIRLVFYDDGLGIKKHLTRKPYEETHRRFQQLISKETYRNLKAFPSNFAIEKASIYEVSGTNYTDNSGAGLAFLLEELSIPTNGNVTIISGDGYVSWTQGRIVKSYALPYKLHGTLVALKIDVVPDSILAYDEDEIPEGFRR